MIPWKSFGLFREIDHRLWKEQNAVADAEQKAVNQARANITNNVGNLKRTLKNIFNAAEIVETNPDAIMSGPAGELMALDPNTPAGELRSYIGVVISQGVIDVMMKLKEASAHGSTGFGQLNREELKMLINQMGAIDPKTTRSEVILATLNDLGQFWEQNLKKIALDPQMTQELAEGYGVEKLLWGEPGNKEAFMANPELAESYSARQHFVPHFVGEDARAQAEAWNAAGNKGLFRINGRPGRAK